ncbi:ATP-binding protein [Methanolobus halotolerans]|uniref:(4Fe-4S)-binding protein n=1 Tax=Methanolobus halotolerans TaxID=2052935 RepID=A0A4E0QCD1_9EURY|nr:ATP-binding protein [Methanolobus halotolerans]TGC10927.1 (4Fe-4S)-binding protein [Methanolobus halotolerans]
MKIAVASGKGGTGKTTVAVNLALSIGKVQLIDCDVEEPDCNLFLRSDIDKYQDVILPVPRVDGNKCIQCGKCVQFCQYNALAVLSSGPMLFPQLCHGCGGCMLICPENAITEDERITGVIERSRSDARIDLWQGELFTGEPMASPVIRQLKTNIREGEGEVVIIDSPPGTACPVIASLRDVDYCILVTEPTPFGLNDLMLAVEVVRQMGIPFGVIINRNGMGYDGVEVYCNSGDIPVLMKIPDKRQIAVLYSEGIPFVMQMTEWKGHFLKMFEDVCRQILSTKEN